MCIDIESLNLERESRAILLERASQRSSRTLRMCSPRENLAEAEDKTRRRNKRGGRGGGRGGGGKGGEQSE